MHYKRWFCALAAFMAAMGGTVVTEAADSSERIVYDVTDYQAYPDNELDDTKELQRVLDFAINSDETVTIVVPAGVYNVSGTLTVYSNTHLIFEEGAQIITTGGDLIRGGHVDEYGNVCDNRKESCTHGDYTQTHDVLIEGGTLLAPGRDDHVSSGFLVFSHGKDITVRGMTIDGYCSHAIRFYGCKDVLVEDCVIKNNPTTYARDDAGAFESIQLGDNCVDATAGYPYPHDDSLTRDAVIRDCVFENVVTGIGNHANCEMVNGVLIEGCTFTDVGGTHGMGRYDGQGYGIDLSTISHAVIRDNTFSMTKYAYAAICGTLWETGTSVGHEIYGNTIYSPGDYGISLEYGATAEIYDNYIKGGKWLYGIQVTGASSAVVHDNTFEFMNSGLIARGDVEAYDNTYIDVQLWNTDELERRE